jgi:hypothetical protein
MYNNKNNNKIKKTQPTYKNNDPLKKLMEENKHLTFDEISSVQSATINKLYATINKLYKIDAEPYKKILQDPKLKDFAEGLLKISLEAHEQQIQANQGDEAPLGAIADLQDQNANNVPVVGDNQDNQ